MAECCNRAHLLLYIELFLLLIRVWSGVAELARGLSINDQIGHIFLKVSENGGRGVNNLKKVTGILSTSKRYFTRGSIDRRQNNDNINHHDGNQSWWTLKKIANENVTPFLSSIENGHVNRLPLVSGYATKSWT